jgi:hypothetical protein
MVEAWRLFSDPQEPLGPLSALYTLLEFERRGHRTICPNVAEPLVGIRPQDMVYWND